MTGLTIHREVEAALASGAPVVALETAVMTHGLPRHPAGPAPAAPDLDEPDDPDDPDAPAWSPESPLPLEVVRAMSRAVRDMGAVPAIVGVLDGVLHVGLDDANLTRLAHDTECDKASTATLAGILATGRSAGTTVSATLTASRLARPAPIRVMATGGIGGVHAGWTRRPDISVDLRELAQTAAIVVCSGAKSILDLPATLETLETLGVPVIGDGTDSLPRFLAIGDERLPVTMRIDDPALIAALAAHRWVTLRQSGAVLVTRNPPAECAIDPATLDDALRTAGEQEPATGAGPARTPHLLAAVARLTGDRSVRANVGLLLSNARRAAEIAVAVSRDPLLRSAMHP